MNKFFNILSLILISSSLLIADNATVALEQSPEQAPKNLLYNQVGNLILESEDHLVKPQMGTLDKKDERTKEQKLQDSLKDLDEVRKKEITFNLFSSYGKLGDQTNNTIEPYILHELSIVCGSESSKKANLFRKLNKTETVFGGAVLARLISEPITDKNILLKRQNIVKSLAQNKALSNKLSNALQVLKKYESGMLNFWNVQAEIDPELLKRVVWPKVTEAFNKQPQFLQNGRRYQLFNLGLTFTITPVAMIAMPCIYARAAGGPGLAFGLLYSGLMGYTLKMVKDEFSTTNHIYYTMHAKMRATAETIKALEDICEVVTTQKDLVKGMTAFNELYNFVYLADKISSELVILKNLLKDDEFFKEPTWHSHMGNIVTSFTYMQEIKNQFVKALEGAGELDAYLSIAKVMNEFSDKNVNYCYVDYIDQQMPSIELEEVWNPLIDAEYAISENVLLGHPNAQKVMLTGPHGGGKSTFMKSVSYSLILGQTFGIAPAKRAAITIFDKINSYVNIKEDLAAGQSTFMAEKKRVDEIKLSLLDTNFGKKSFTIMDEVFKGTMEDEGARRLYNFGKDLVKNSTPDQDFAVMLIATHFQKPADLEIETQRFTNYHVGLIENNDSTFTRTFKIVPGKNEWWFNDKDKRERYIDWLTSIN